MRVVTTRKEYISKMSTHEIEERLPPHLFKRIHRSFIVSLNKIESYTADMMELSGGTSIPIGRDYRGIMDSL